MGHNGDAAQGLLAARSRAGRERRHRDGGVHDIDTGSCELWARCRAGDETARDALIEQHPPVCRRIARRTEVLATPALGYDDLEGAKPFRAAGVAILASYYDEGLSFPAISRQLEVSEARISQLHSRAIVQLQMLLGVVGTSKARTVRAAA
jgi:hypothetical protein